MTSIGFQKAHGPMLSDAALKGYWGDLIQPGMIGFGTETVSACMGDSGTSIKSVKNLLH